MYDVMAIGNALVDHEYLLSDAALEETELTKGKAYVTERSRLHNIATACGGDGSAPPSPGGSRSVRMEDRGSRRRCPGKPTGQARSRGPARTLLAPPVIIVGTRRGTPGSPGGAGDAPQAGLGRRCQQAARCGSGQGGDVAGGGHVGATARSTTTPPVRGLRLE